MSIKTLQKTTGYIATGLHMHELIYSRTKELLGQAERDRDAISTPEACLSRAEMIRQVFIDSIGGLPDGEYPLNPQIAGSIQCAGYRIERIIIESRPRTYVTCNLYVPDHIRQKRPAVLFVCGHHQMAKHQADEYQVVCRTLVESGLIVLAHDPIGQGERLSFYEPSIQDTTVGWGTTEHEYVGQQCLPLGHSIARYFVHDSMRALDYLISRPEVDASRVGITGNSGGGLQTTMMMMADRRLAAAAPATFVMNRDLYMEAGSGQDAEQIWPGSTAKGLDHEDFLICMAPKPVLVLAVKYDFFPIEATRLTVSRGRRMYELFGKPDCLELFEDTTVHRYTRAMALQAARFFRKHLAGDELTDQELERIRQVEPIESGRLLVTKSGQVRADYPDARGVTEENVREAALLASRGSDQQREATAWLKEQVFLDRRPCDLNPRFYAGNAAPFENLLFAPLFWYAQSKVINHGYLFTPLYTARQRLPVTLAIWDQGTDALDRHYAFLKEECGQGRAVLVADLTGIGKVTPVHTAPNPAPDAYFSTMHTLADNLVWIGDSLPALRTYDVTRLVDLIGQIDTLDGSDLKIYCQGRQGLCGLLAALIDPRIRQVVDQTRFTSYHDLVSARYYDAYDIKSIILPGILKHFDLPELRQWIANSVILTFHVRDAKN
jgi:cephalosporin-C deacetylase-like acetyl esterase